VFACVHVAGAGGISPSLGAKKNIQDGAEQTVKSKNLFGYIYSLNSNSNF
jgi:hypothetical protein